MLPLQNQFIHLPQKPVAEFHIEQPLPAIPAAEMLDNSVSPLISLVPRIRVLGSQSDTDNMNSYLNHLKSQSFPSVNPLVPLPNPSDTEATSRISKALSTSIKVESLEDFTVPMIGYSLLNTEREHARISKNIEAEVLAEVGVSNKRKSRYISNEALQSEETRRTKATQSALSSRIYRAKITEGLKELKNALPYYEKGDQASMLENAIDYIKFLKLRLNVLSQNRLIGEASTHPFVHIEGYGHYLLHPEMHHEPLEEMIGCLMNSNPQTATELLECMGLAVVPMDYAYSILLCSLNPPWPCQ